MKYYLVETEFNYGGVEYTSQILLTCHEGDDAKERLYTCHYSEMFGDDDNTRRDDDNTFWQSDDCARCSLYGIAEIPKSDFLVLQKYIPVINAPIKEEKVVFA